MQLCVDFRVTSALVRSGVAIKCTRLKVGDYCWLFDAKKDGLVFKKVLMVIEC